MDRQVACLFCT